MSRRMSTTTGRSRLLLPPLKERLANGRPVLTRDQALGLAKRVMAMSTGGDGVKVFITHTVRSVTRLANDEIRSTDDGEEVSVRIYAEPPTNDCVAVVETNQLDDASLRDLVARADRLAQEMLGPHENIMVQMQDQQDTYRPARLWHESTVEAMRAARETTVSDIVDTVRREQFRASGFIGITAKAEAVMTGEGIMAFSDETDSEVTVTARPADGKTTGWGGQAARDWAKIDPARIATDAVEIAKRNQNPQALEPGRRTAILGPAAVVQLMRFLVLHFNGMESDMGKTGFSKIPGNERSGSRWNQRMFDPCIQITSDPADPDGGFRPWFWKGYANNARTWIDKGCLKNLGYFNADMGPGKPGSQLPHGLRLQGGETTVEQMIAQCEEGIYVHRFSDVDCVDMKSGMLTGATRDGCFYVKNGKINRPVKNFRFLDSPFFFLNNLLALGPTQRTAFGYSPPTMMESWYGNDAGCYSHDWPRWPMIVPPMMVRDFNFSALIDAI